LSIFTYFDLRSLYGQAAARLVHARGMTRATAPQPGAAKGGRARALQPTGKHVGGMEPSLLGKTAGRALPFISNVISELPHPEWSGLPLHRQNLRHRYVTSRFWFYGHYGLFHPCDEYVPGIYFYQLSTSTFSLVRNIERVWK